MNAVRLAHAVESLDPLGPALEDAIVLGDWYALGSVMERVGVGERMTQQDLRVFLITRGLLNPPPTRDLHRQYTAYRILKDIGGRVSKAAAPRLAYALASHVKKGEITTQDVSLLLNDLWRWGAEHPVIRRTDLYSANKARLAAHALRYP